VEASTLQHAGAAGLHGRSPLLRLQSDERLVALVRRGNQAAFEALVARYQSRLLAFCRHMLSSREDAEDVLQEVFAAAFNAMLADGRAINVRPWLYRIARNRSLNHLRRTQAIGVDSMDIHLSEGGLTTADKVHKREEFRQLVSDLQDLPETQRTALLLREIDALSYEQISEAMETTVPSVKSLLVRARVSLAEAAEARLLTCEEVRDELGEVAEGLRRTTPPVRRHLRTCDRCVTFRKQLQANNKALAAVFPVAPLLLLKKTLLAHFGMTAAASGGTAAAAGGSAAAASAGGAALQAGASALATKAAAGLAAAAIVTAGAVEVKHVAVDRSARPATIAAATPAAAAAAEPSAPVAVRSAPQPAAPRPAATRAPSRAARRKAAAKPKLKPAADATKPTLVAAVTPLREQHEGDTTSPTETAGSMEQTNGALPPGQATPPPAAQPSPQPQPQPSPESSPQPSPTPGPVATPEPTPTPWPTPTPTPGGPIVTPGPAPSPAAPQPPQD
jgi:RNA polymerase sigma factor (sigma-70 family)